jgi:queuosine precursor transporter
MTSTPGKNAKELSLFVVLASLFLTNALIAEIVGVKIFSLEGVFGLKPAHLPFIGGTKLDFNLSVGVIIWPFVFILTDIINEYFGKKGVRQLSFLGAGMIGYAFFIIYGGTKLPPAQFWLDLNSKAPSGNFFDINYAYSAIFRQGLGIIVGSIIAFLVGQLVDMYVFHYLRKITGHKKLWIRATGSTIISQIIDSFLILYIAFYWLGNWSLMQVLAVGLVQYCYKVGLAILFTPLVYVVHYFVDKYLGSGYSDEMIETADKSYQRVSQ